MQYPFQYLRPLSNLRSNRMREEVRGFWCLQMLSYIWIRRPKSLLNLSTTDRKCSTYASPPRGCIISTGLLFETTRAATRRVFPLFARKMMVFCQISANLSRLLDSISNILFKLKSQTAGIVFNPFSDSIQSKRHFRSGSAFCNITIFMFCSGIEILLLFKCRHPSQLLIPSL